MGKIAPKISETIAPQGEKARIPRLPINRLARFRKGKPNSFAQKRVKFHRHNCAHIHTP